MRAPDGRPFVRDGVGEQLRSGRKTLDVVDRKLTRMPRIPEPVEAGAISGGGIRRLTCTEFVSTDITTGSGFGNPWTLYRPNLWVIGGGDDLQPSDVTPAAPDVVVSGAGDAAAFDVVEEGFYTLRYSIIAGFASDASCPPWVNWQVNTYYQNRPYIGVEHMTTGNLTGAYPGHGLPGSTWEIVVPRFYQAAFSPDNGYSLSVRLQWPGIGQSPNSWSIYADLSRVA